MDVSGCACPVVCWLCQKNRKLRYLYTFLALIRFLKSYINTFSLKVDVSPSRRRWVTHHGGEILRRKSMTVGGKWFVLWFSELHVARFTTPKWSAGDVYFGDDMESGHLF